MGVNGKALEKRVISPGRGGVFEPRIDSGDLLPLLGDDGASPSDWMTKTGEDTDSEVENRTYEEEILSARTVS